MKKLIVILTILTTLRLSAQVCDDVNLTVTTTSSINYSFDTFGKYVAGLTENGASRLKVTVDNSLTNNPNCRWNLVLYVENASATTANTDWEETKGVGEIYTYSVMHRSPSGPYAIGYVKMAEGVHVLTNFVECDFAALKIGMKVKVLFQPTENGPPVPVFAPA